MQKESVVDLFTVLRTLALACALMGLALVLLGVGFPMVTGMSPMNQVTGLAGALGLTGLIGGLGAAAVLSIARWLVWRSTFRSPQGGGATGSPLQ